MKKYDLEPRIPDERYVGAKSREVVLYLGDLAESGREAKAYLDLSSEFVLFEVGKRGSGKSYSMGALLEGLATKQKRTSISTLTTPRGVLLLDPLDVHWTAIFPVREDGPPEIKKQYELLKKWPGLKAEEVDIQVWMPAGKATKLDHPAFKEYFLPVSSFDAADWSELLRTDLVVEPRGQLIYEAYTKVTELGWNDGRQNVQPNPEYGIQDLLNCISNDQDIQQSGIYLPNTIRSVTQPLQAYQRLPLFSRTTGTPLTQLIQKGALSILSLSRLEPDLRTVVATVLVKSIMKERRDASFLEKRLALESLSPDSKNQIEETLRHFISRTILVLDEAQILLPAEGSSSARKALESFVLEGRNYGLSLWLATQRPSGAISPAARSQVDLFMIHRLSVKEDIAGMLSALQSDPPTRIISGRQEITFEDLIRRLDTGQAVISSADTQASSNRAFVVNVRPRVTCHGGKAF